MQGRKFKGMEMGNTALTDADLSEISLERVLLKKCDMRGVLLKEAKFKSVAIVACNLEKADFSDADANGLVIVDCSLEGASFSWTTAHKLVLSNCTGRVSFKCSQLSEVFFSGCKLESSDFSGAEIHNSRIEKSNLACCTFWHAELYKVLFDRSCLTNVRLNQADELKGVEMKDVTVAPFYNPKGRTQRLPFGVVANSRLPRVLGKKRKPFLLGSCDSSAHFSCSNLKEFWGAL